MLEESSNGSVIVDKVRQIKDEYEASYRQAGSLQRCIDEVMDVSALAAGAA